MILDLDRLPRCSLPQGCDEIARYMVSAIDDHPAGIFGARTRYLCTRHTRSVEILAERYGIVITKSKRIGWLKETSPAD